MVHVQRFFLLQKYAFTFHIFLFLLPSIFWSGDCARWPLDEDWEGSKGHLRRTRRDFQDDFDSSGIISADYNINVPPATVNGSASHVQMAILVVNVRDIKDLSEELTLEVNLKMSWKDERLQHLANWAKNHNETFIVLHPDTLHKLWHPDIYIDHVKTITQPSIASKPASLRVYADSTLRYSARLTLAQACQMDFHYYPADTQRCTVDFMSYAYNDAKLNLTWKGGHGASLVNKLSLPNVDVGMDQPENFVIVTASGRYSALRFTILLRRKLSYHMLQTYLPSTLFIVVSWLSFLVPADQVSGRMALCMTTLLTLTAMFSSVRQNIPTVSYIKAIDVWMVSMIFFVFLTLLEYTAILKLKSVVDRPVPKKCKKKEKVIEIPMKRILTTNGASAAATPTSAKSPYEPHLPFLTNQAKSIDTVSPRTPQSGEVDTEVREILPEMAESHSGILGWSLDRIDSMASKIIPSLFVLFQFVYWPWLLHRAKYYQQFSSTVYYSAF